MEDLLEVYEVVEQIALVLELLLDNDLTRLKICSTVLRPGLKLACSSAISSQPWP